jgi:hypothetical protein
MRGMFTAYLEQLGALEGPDLEELMCSALAAVDQLDNALTLVKVGRGGGPPPALLLLLLLLLPRAPAAAARCCCR